MRRAVALLALLLVVPAGAAGANPRDEQERLRPADMALARRIALKPGDLGVGWARTAASVEDDQTMRCPGWNPDFSAFTITGKAISAFVSQSGGSVLSGVEVYATKAHAVGDFRTGARPALAGCLRTSLERQFKQTGVRGDVVSSRMTRAPRLGEHSAAFRAVVRLRANGTTVPVYMDFLVLHRGRSLASLLLSGAFRPMPDQRSLARRVVARMR